VLETDAPDMPPHWLYRTVEQRANGHEQGRNEPEELPRIAEVLVRLRDVETKALAMASFRAAEVALPRLGTLLRNCPPSA